MTGWTGPTGLASLPAGVVTSIGSLPHRTSEAAVAFSLERQPELPAAPTIPVARPIESMIASAGWGVAGVTVQPDGALVVDPRALDPEAPLQDPGLEGAPFATLQVFLGAVADRAGPIKAQLTGPLTLGVALRAAGVADGLAFRIAAAAVRQRALHLVAVAGRQAPHAPLVVFLDEPALAASVRGATVDAALDPDRTIDLVSGALAVLEPHAVTGLHCCGVADWRAAMQAGPQVLSLPVGGGVAASAGALASFLDGGGRVAWGAVPTDGPLGAHPSRLWRRLAGEWHELADAGCDPVALRRQALVTPVCGLAGHGEAQAERVLELTRAVAGRLDDAAWGPLPSVDA